MPNIPKNIIAKVIVISDNSTDNSVGIAKQYQCKGTSRNSDFRTNYTNGNWNYYFSK